MQRCRAKEKSYTIYHSKNTERIWRKHSMLIFTWMPIKVLRANSMLVSVKKSWGIFPIKQKFDTMAAFLYSKNSETKLVSSSKTCYHCADLVLRRSKSARRYSFSSLSKLIWFWQFSLSTKAAIVLNFCLIGKIPHDFSILTNIELARKTFIGIQVRLSIEWYVQKI